MAESRSGMERSLNHASPESVGPTKTSPDIACFLYTGRWVEFSTGLLCPLGDDGWPIYPDEYQE